MILFESATAKIPVSSPKTLAPLVKTPFEKTRDPIPTLRG
jgi:hypothetical protein